MAKFNAPSLERPTGGHYGDPAPGIKDADGAILPASPYHQRLWFGASKGTSYTYEVYALLGHVQLWADGDVLVKARPLAKTPQAEQAMAGLAPFLGRAGLAAFRAQAEAAGAKFDHLRTERKVVKARKPSLRDNVWKAAHRVAATCLHGLEEVPDDIEPMESVLAAPREWGLWWKTLGPWAKVAIARACEDRIRVMLDDGSITIAAWLKHFATLDWRGRDHGYSIRPAVGKTRRSCFDVLLGEWIDPESGLVKQAEGLLKRANATRTAKGRQPWSWNT